MKEHFMRELMQIPLLRLFILNGAMGIAFGIAIGATLFAFDYRGVGELAWRTEGGFLAFAMVCAGLSVTCASAAIATAVMLLPERAEDDTGYGHFHGHGRGRGTADRDELQCDRRTAVPAHLAKPPNAPHRIPTIPNKPEPDADA